MAPRKPSPAALEHALHSALRESSYDFGCQCPGGRPEPYLLVTGRERAVHVCQAHRFPCQFALALSQALEPLAVAGLAPVPEVS